MKLLIMKGLGRFLFVLSYVTLILVQSAKGLTATRFGKEPSRHVLKGDIRSKIDRKNVILTLNGKPIFSTKKPDSTSSTINQETPPQESDNRNKINLNIHINRRKQQGIPRQDDSDSPRNQQIRITKNYEEFTTKPLQSLVSALKAGMVFNGNRNIGPLGFDENLNHSPPMQTQVMSPNAAAAVTGYGTPGMENTINENLNHSPPTQSNGINNVFLGNNWNGISMLPIGTNENINPVYPMQGIQANGGIGNIGYSPFNMPSDSVNTVTNFQTLSHPQVVPGNLQATPLTGSYLQSNVFPSNTDSSLFGAVPSVGSLQNPGIVTSHLSPGQSALQQQQGSVNQVDQNIGQNVCQECPVNCQQIGLEVIPGHTCCLPQDQCSKLDCVCCQGNQCQCCQGNKIKTQNQLSRINPAVSYQPNPGSRQKQVVLVPIQGSQMPSQHQNNPGLNVNRQTNPGLVLVPVVLPPAKEVEKPAQHEPGKGNKSNQLPYPPPKSNSKTLNADVSMLSNQFAKAFTVALKAESHGEKLLSKKPKKNRSSTKHNNFHLVDENSFYTSMNGKDINHGSAKIRFHRTKINKRINKALTKHMTHGSAEREPKITCKKTRACKKMFGNKKIIRKKLLKKGQNGKQKLRFKTKKSSKYKQKKREKKKVKILSDKLLSTKSEHGLTMKRPMKMHKELYNGQKEKQKFSFKAKKSSKYEQKKRERKKVKILSDTLLSKSKHRVTMKMRRKIHKELYNGQKAKEKLRFKVKKSYGRKKRENEIVKIFSDKLLSKSKHGLTIKMAKKKHKELPAVKEHYANILYNIKLGKKITTFSSNGSPKRKV